MVNRLAVPFLHDPATHELIETVAQSTALTIFAGAGISKDRGCPDWQELVVLLLAEQLRMEVGPKHGTDRKLPFEEASRVFTESTEPIVAASAIRTMYDQKNDRLDDRAITKLIAQEIHKQLYSGNRWLPQSPLANAIVRLAIFWKFFGDDTAIITTNYDSNLEEFAGDVALKNEAAARHVRLEPRVDNRTVKHNAVPVYHLHGYIPREGKQRGNLAFSEVGLATGRETLPGTGAQLDWRSAVLDARLTSSTTIFVGTTLRDQTICDALVRTRAQAGRFPRYGVFAYQGDEWCSEQQEVRELADLAWRRRLEHLKVTPLRPDFFAQVALLLNEVVHCRINMEGKYVGEDAAPGRYGGRLSAWWREWHVIVSSSRPATLVDDNCQRLLADARDELARILKRRPREVLKLELWVRHDPAHRRELELWGSSETARRSSKSAHRSLIENASRYAAVRAFCEGFAVRGSLDQSSRWRSYFSMPVVLTDEPYHHLPVGVVNIMSTAEEKQSCLGAVIDASTWPDVVRLLSTVGQSILDPRSPELSRQT